MSTLPSTKQLRYFVALEQYRHFGKAAEASFVSQPAFSVAIRELESVLGTRLVDRTNRRVTITNTGRDVVTQARLVLRDLEALVELAREGQAPLSGKLNLGVIPTIAPFLLPAILPKLRRSYPALQLYLQEEMTQRIYAQLMDGLLDLILVALPYDMRGVEHMPLFKDPFLLACHKNSTLLDPEHYRVEQLPTESVLLLQDGHCLRDHTLSACKLRNVNKISRVTASSLLTLIHMVDADLGITYLPAMARGSVLLRHTRIATFPLATGSFREIGLVWRKGSVRGEEFRLLGEFIRENREKKK